MALSLTLNGATTAIIPGSPSTGDRIAMSNGTIRLSFVWQVHATSPARWWSDLIEYSPDGGSSWQTQFYMRDMPRANVNGGGGDIAMTNQTLAIITNTAGNITLQTQASKAVASGTNTGAVITLTQNWIMTTTNAVLQCQQYAATDTALTLTSNQFLEEWGSAYITAGLRSATTALYENVGSTFDNTRVDPIIFLNNRATSRSFGRPANTNARGFQGGMSFVFSNGTLATFFASPVDYQNLVVNVKDNGGTARGSPEWQFSQGGYNSFLKSTDNAYVSVTDNDTAMIRPGCRFGSSTTGVTMPISASNTDTTTTINFIWALAIETPTITWSTSSLSVPLWYPIQRINYWIDTIYPRPTIAAQWQTLSTMETTILPTVASNYSALFSNTWGYLEHVSDVNTYTNFSNALALQCVLRHAAFNVGNGRTDALAMADKLAVCIANYQQQGTAQAGAIQKIRNVGPDTFTCQDTTHQASGDQPHMSSYTMAEAVLALIEYYRVRGNQTLSATYGSVTVATVLNQAMDYLIGIQTTDGGWLVEYNNANTFTSTNGRIGRTMPGSSTVDFSASLYEWSTISPTATATQKTNWKNSSARGWNYWLTSEISAHGCYEYGEDYVNYSSHAVKMLSRGFGRLYKLLGSPIFQEYSAFYFEIGCFLCKKVDEIENKPVNGGDNGTNGQDVHTGALMCTIDFSGVESGEISNGWHYWLTDGIRFHPNPIAHDYFYLWGSLQHQTWAYRDLTYLLSYPFSYAYCSPGTNASGFASGIDNTRFTYFAPGGALHLLPVQSMVQTSNTLILATAMEGNIISDPGRRTILLWNSQGTSQSSTITVIGMGSHKAYLDGVEVTGTTVSGNLQVSVSFTSGQTRRLVVQ